MLLLLAPSAALLSREADTGSTLSVAVRLDASCASEDAHSSSTRPISAAKPFLCMRITQVGLMLHTHLDFWLHCS